MKKLLFISRPFLGETLFATPCMEILSKEYEIILLCYPPYVAAFKDYKFIKKVLVGCNTTREDQKLPQETILEIQKEFTFEIDGYYAYINDEDTPFWRNHPELHYIKKYPLLDEADIKCMQRPDGAMYHINRTRNYLLKLQLISLEEMDKFDCTVRVPNYEKKETTNQIVIYEGSREVLRKLPDFILEKLSEKIPNATFLVQEDTATKLKLAERGIKYFTTFPYVDGVLEKIIDLFKSSPKAMIGPDSGLTQLALGYKIPMVWLQSRIPMESVIDYQYKSICHVFKKNDPICARNCLSWKADFSNEKLKHGLFDPMDAPRNYKLECFKTRRPSCLEYSDHEIDRIIDMVNSL